MASETVELESVGHWRSHHSSRTSSEQATRTVSHRYTDLENNENYAPAFQDNQMSIVQDELPPVDRGFGACLYLTVAFLVEALCWGFSFSFGVFQSYYSSTPQFEGSKVISVIGTLATGVPYLSSAGMFSVCSRYPNQRKNLMWAGLVFCVGGCVGGSFATQTWHLIASQGVLYGIGTTLLYVPIYSMLNEWFVKRLGLAVGIIYSGTGISGLVLPLVFDRILEKYGFASALRIWAVFITITLIPALYFVRGRLPPTQVVATRRLDLSFFRSPLFYVFSASNFLQGLGYFLPSIYLPSYASSLSLSSTTSTLLLSMFNLATVFGQIIMGWSSDRVDVHNILFVSSFIAGLSVFVIWGLSKSLAPLLVFAIMYGLSAGGYSVLWSRFASRVAGDENGGILMTVFGVFAAQKGIGSVLSGPISSMLLGEEEKMQNYAIGRYEKMVIFVGITMVASSFGAGGRLLK